MSYCFPGDWASYVDGSTNIEKERFLPSSIFRRVESCHNRISITNTVFYINNISSACHHLCVDILGVSHIYRAITGYLIIVVYASQISEFEMSCIRGSFAAHALL